MRYVIRARNKKSTHHTWLLAEFHDTEAEARRRMKVYWVHGMPEHWEFHVARCLPNDKFVEIPEIVWEEA